MEWNHDISPQDVERIEQFLSGAMQPDDAAAFEKELENDKLLQDKLKEIRLLQLGISQAEIKNQLPVYHAALPSKKGKIISLRSRWMLAACSILVIALAGWWFLSSESSYDKLYSQYYSPDPGLITAMGPSSNYNFERAMVDYKNGDYQQAIDAWSLQEKEQPASDTLLYFLSMAHMAAGHNEQAITYIEKTLTQTQSVFYKDACWFYGLMLIKKGTPDKAKIFIEKAGRPESAALLTALNKN